MKYKSLILVSTVIVFILATILSFVWLFQVRYIDVDVVADDVQKQEMYDEINDVLTNSYRGKSFFSFTQEEIEKKLVQNPYVSIKTVRKVFPDRIQVVVAKRREIFAFDYNSTFYVTDSEYHLLRKETDENLLAENVMKITLTEIELDESTLILGEKMGYANDKLVGSMTAIFNEFTDGLNLVKSITIRGKQNWIDFYTKTGVCIEFSFRPSSPSLSDGEKKAEMQEIINSASEAEQTYLLLSESEKRLGYVLVYMKANGEVCVEHAEKKAEVN